MLQDDNVSLQDFIARQRKSGQWGSTIDMVFASLVLNINIISISNLPKRFEEFSTIEFLKRLNLDYCVPKNSKEIYIYHHMFGDPFSPCLSPNHFCSMMQVHDQESIESMKWYERADFSSPSNEIIDVTAARGS